MILILVILAYSILIITYHQFLIFNKHLSSKTSSLRNIYTLISSFWWVGSKAVARGRYGSLGEQKAVGDRLLDSLSQIGFGFLEQVKASEERYYFYSILAQYLLHIHILQCNYCIIFFIPLPLPFTFSFHLLFSYFISMSAAKFPLIQLQPILYSLNFGQ